MYSWLRRNCRHINLSHTGSVSCTRSCSSVWALHYKHQPLYCRYGLWLCDKMCTSGIEGLCHARIPELRTNMLFIIEFIKKWSQEEGLRCVSALWLVIFQAGDNFEVCKYFYILTHGESIVILKSNSIQPLFYCAT